MEYQVQLVQAAPQLTAVVRCRARVQDLSKVVPQLCGEVWQFAKTAGLPRPGRHVALYLQDQEERDIEVGAEVWATFTGDGRVVCSSLPTGAVARVEHFGPYSRLGDAHAAVRQWCAAQGHALAGPFWEIYGHWTDDPTQLRTDVCYLLPPAND
jgi:effector-binding domain-containing protein